MHRMIFAFLLVSIWPTPISAHPGGLDAQGGHTDRSTGQYHCHREPCFSIMAARSEVSSPATQPAIPPVTLDVVSVAPPTDDCHGILKYGIPRQSDEILRRLGYAEGYNYSRKTASWVRSKSPVVK